MSTHASEPAERAKCPCNLTLRPDGVEGRRANAAPDWLRPSQSMGMRGWTNSLFHMQDHRTLNDRPADQHRCRKHSSRSNPSRSLSSYLCRPCH